MKLLVAAAFAATICAAQAAPLSVCPLTAADHTEYVGSSYRVRFSNDLFYIGIGGKTGSSRSATINVKWNDPKRMVDLHRTVNARMNGGIIPIRFTPAVYETRLRFQGAGGQYYTNGVQSVASSAAGSYIAATGEPGTIGVGTYRAGDLVPGEYIWIATLIPGGLTTDSVELVAVRGQTDAQSNAMLLVDTISYCNANNFRVVVPHGWVAAPKNFVATYGYAGSADEFGCNKRIVPKTLDKTPAFAARPAYELHSDVSRPSVIPC